MRISKIRFSVQRSISRGTEFRWNCDLRFRRTWVPLKLRPQVLENLRPENRHFGYGEGHHHEWLKNNFDIKKRAMWSSWGLTVRYHLRYVLRIVELAFWGSGKLAIDLHLGTVRFIKIWKWAFIRKSFSDYLCWVFQLVAWGSRKLVFDVVHGFWYHITFISWVWTPVSVYSGSFGGLILW